jgi:isoleucyl-tRNA synthetase
MGVVREAVELGRSARSHAKVKLRQPLRAAVIVASGAERDALEAHGDIVREELNVKELRFVSESANLGSYEIKPNYRALGPRFGKQMPQLAAAVASLDPGDVAAALREGRTVGVNVEGAEHELGPDDLQLAMQPLEGYQVERAGSHAVALELELDDELRREGLAREVIHAIQAARKDAGLNVSDRIELAVDGDDELLAASREHERAIAGEVLATSFTIGTADAHAPQAAVDGMALRIALRKS